MPMIRPATGVTRAMGTKMNEISAKQADADHQSGHAEAVAGRCSAVGAAGAGLAGWAAAIVCSLSQAAVRSSRRHRLGGHRKTVASR